MNDMALKNTYTRLPAGRHIQMAQDALIKAGASGISTLFDEGRIIGLAFTIKIGENNISFKLPVNWRSFQNVLRKEDNRRADEDEYAYRVAWACVADWIEAQMAFIESENVSLPQVFLPYAVTKNGDTLFETIVNNPSNFLGDGK